MNKGPTLTVMNAGNVEERTKNVLIKTKTVGTVIRVVGGVSLRNLQLLATMVAGKINGVIIGEAGINGILDN